MNRVAVIFLIIFIPFLSEAKFKRTKGTVKRRSYSKFSKFINSSIGQEIGFGIGSSNYMGELGGANNKGRPLFFDYELSKTRPLINIFYRNNFTPHLAIRGDFTYANIAGSDNKTGPGTEFSYEWYRNYRNLSFKSTIFELAVLGEYNFMRYAFGRRRSAGFSPYVNTGFALFYHNPKALYKSPGGQTEWVSLQPLGTEGQGLPEYPTKKKYARFQPAIPLAVGVKYKISGVLNFSFELAYRITFTDYLDDVSTTYVDPSLYSNTITEPDKLAHAIALSRRSVENDPDNTYGYITEPGQQRGDPRDKDVYFFSGVFKLSYLFKRGRTHSPKF